MNGERFLSFGEERRYKLILVGDSSVGKTALFWRFIEGEYSQEKTTQVTTVDFRIKNVYIKSQPIKLYIWDTAGQERYRSIVSTYFKGCHGVLLVFDISNAASFDNLKKSWLELVRSKAPSACKMLIANKIDLEHQVDDQQVKKWANEQNLKLLFCSAKKGEGVEEAFMELSRTLIEQEAKVEKTQSFALKNGRKQEKGCC